MARNSQLALSFRPEYPVVGMYPTVLTFNAHLVAPEVLDDENKRSEISLTAVIDKSGSMHGDKIELVKKSCSFMLNQLGTGDKIGLVEFDTNVHESIVLSRASDTFKTKASTVIDSMRTGSCTNLSGGLFAGVKQQQESTYVDWDSHGQKDNIEQRSDQGNSTLCLQQAPNMPRPASSPDVNLQSAPPCAGDATNNMQGAKRHTLSDHSLRSVFLLTDGQANHGITSSSQFVDVLRNTLDAGPRVRVCTFGFGTDHCPELLADLATVGAGTYYFLGSEEAIPRAFADALGGLLSVAAQNVRLEFRPASGVAVQAVHTGFKTSGGSHGGKVVDLGDVLSAESKDLLFEVQLPAAEFPADDSRDGRPELVGTLELSYLDVQGARLRTDVIECRVLRAERVPDDVVPDESVVLQKLRVETATALGEARAAAEGGRLGDARAGLHRALEAVQGAAGGGEGGLKEQLAKDLAEAMESVGDREQFRRRGPRMVAMGKAHMEQRSACLSSSSSSEEEAEEEELKRDEGELCSAAAPEAGAQKRGRADSDRGAAGKGKGKGKGGKFSYTTACQSRMRKSAKREIPVPSGKGKGGKGLRFAGGSDADREGH